MNTGGKALLMVGSPRARNKSTSESLGTYLLDRLNDKGLETEKCHINPSLRSEESMADFLAKVEGSDILILAFPLYVDSLPSMVIKALELISEQRVVSDTAKKQRLLAISNNGFPEVEQNCTALYICRLFARDAVIEWAGELALGGG